MKRRPLVTVWLRMQETPLELAIAGLAVAASILGLITEWDTLPALYVCVYLALGVGGLLIVAGRIREWLHTESAGLALMLGTFAFLTVRALGQSHGVEQIGSVLLNYGALAAGFGVRLYVVRKAVRARVVAAQLWREHRRG